MEQTPRSFVVRDSQPDDMPDIARIYGHWVLHGLASFELDPPDMREMTRRRDAVLAGKYPYLVAADSESGEIGRAHV